MLQVRPHVDLMIGDDQSDPSHIMFGEEASHADCLVDVDRNSVDAVHRLIQCRGDARRVSLAVSHERLHFAARS